MKKINSIIIYLTIISIILPYTSQAFVQQWEYTTYQPAGFFFGIWHGLLAPWSLIARWFLSNISMYAISNTGWFYDLGFLGGEIFSIPIGWIAAIISTIGHIFF